jgi:hypothetical protein
VYRATRALLSIVAVVMFGLVGGACASWNVRAQENPNVSLARYRTYAWLVPGKGTAEEKLVGSELDRAVRGEIVEELSDLGFVPTRPGTRPDLLVTYRVSERERIEPVYYGASYGYYGLHQPFAYAFDYPYGYPYSYAYPGWGPAYSLREYTEGTLVLELLDARTGTVVWRGSATRAEDTPARSPDRAAEAVTRIFEKFPVEQRLASMPRQHM